MSNGAGFGRNAERRPAVLSAEVLEKKIGQPTDILTALAEWGNQQFENTQSII